MSAFEDFRIYELIVILYALSLIMYFYDFVKQDRKANQMAFWLLLLVWFLQTIFLFGNIYVTGQLPVFSIMEGLYFYAWLILLVSIVINYFYKVDFLVFVINVVGFIVMIIFLVSHLTNSETSIGVQFIGEMLLAHIILAFLAYTLYTLSFAFSVLYLFQFNMLKKKKWGQTLKRLGRLGQMENLSYLLMVLSTPLLFISLILGIIWAYSTNDLFYWLDAKTIGSFIVLVIYSIILYRKATRQSVGRDYAFSNTIAFSILFLNYFLFTLLSDFHFKLGG
ncbi:cytochrome C assembly family protein [Tenuibacillus multivorans]|uniref:HemX protein n=1 Tax=Tenuibacillus multivorans TaxID=237069 RepID=A0A1G9ZP82_9BACI|nr:cytochrome c biogenesis protein CcsA [Tenuibacillus multivorans]GEL77440.1 protein HemX [Tenuibacillus multivorans]SDN22416.1 HemX protein [Tenuibacillus multivorans]